MLAIFLLLVLSNKSNRQFKWLTNDQFEKGLHPGPPTHLVDKLENALDSLRQHFQTNHPEILISPSVLTFSASATAQTNLGEPAFSGADGTRAWILSPAELNALRQQYKADPGVSNVAATRIQTGNGRQSGITLGQSVPRSGRYTNVGISIDLLAKSSAKLRELAALRQVNRLAGPQTNGQVAIKTNFFAACRALIPDAGAVVIDCGRSLTADQANHGLLFLRS